MRIINLCPHPVTLLGWDDDAEGPGGALRTIPPEDTPARVSSEAETVGRVSDGRYWQPSFDAPGVRLVRQKMGEVTGLPARRPNVWLIVSRMVAAACPGRSDLLVPAEVQRDVRGRITAAHALEQVWGRPHG